MSAVSDLFFGLVGFPFLSADLAGFLEDTTFPSPDSLSCNFATFPSALASFFFAFTNFDSIVFFFTFSSESVKFTTFSPARCYIFQKNPHLRKSAVTPIGRFPPPSELSEWLHLNDRTECQVCARSIEVYQCTSGVARCCIASIHYYLSRDTNLCNQIVKEHQVSTSQMSR